MVDIWHYGDARWCKVVPLGPPHAMYGLHWACCPLALAAPAPTLADARSGMVGLESLSTKEYGGRDLGTS